MNSLPVFVGLDYHQDSVQVCVLNQKAEVLLNRSAPNDCQELKRLITPLGRVERVGIEACCAAADLGEQLVERFGWNVSLGHDGVEAAGRGVAAVGNRWLRCLHQVIKKVPPALTAPAVAVNAV